MKDLMTGQELVEYIRKHINEDEGVFVKKKGYWIDAMYVPSHTKYVCSVCGKEIYTNRNYIAEHKFCFKGGAYMLDDNGEVKIREEMR